MIVSHLNKFIFFKTKKTAGTAVELALAPLCGPSDIITPTDPSEEVNNLRNGHLPRNFRRRGPDTWLPHLYKNIFRPSKLNKTNYYHHMPAELIKKRVGSLVWQSYFKFTVERNPWDRQVSYYYYMRSIRGHKISGFDFSSFLKSRSGNVKNSNIYLIDDTVNADFFIRYESLHDDIVELENQIGVKLGPLPSVNLTMVKDRRPYQELYSSADRQLIEELYWREIELFGYDFQTGVSTRRPIFGQEIK